MYAKRRCSSVRFWALAVFLISFVGCSGLPSRANAETVVPIDTVIDTPQTWDVAGSPYIISGSGFLDIESNLTIEPGVVVRFSPNQSVLVRGSITAQGTADEPILFMPAGEEPCDAAHAWGGLYFDSSYEPSHLEYAQFHCGGVFSGDLGHYEISNYDFESFQIVWVPNVVTGSAFVDVVQGDVTIDHSSFTDLQTSIAMHSGSEYDVHAEHNWWGNASGPTVATNPAGTGFGVTGNTILYDPWTGQDDVVAPTSTPRNPVIFIPGIMGTEFVRRVPGEDDELIWLHLLGLMASREDRFMLFLEMNENSTPRFTDVTTTDVITERGVSGNIFDYTNNLFLYLNQQGYTLNENLFTFPYDWRLGNVETSHSLEAKIAEVMGETGADHVDIIAHSMGGLVVKEYIRQHEVNHHIDKLIFLGTPHLGSPDAIQNLLFGSDLDIKLGNYSFLAPARVKELAQNMPSIYELLPTEQYIRLFGSVLNSSTNTYLKIREFLLTNFNRNLISSAESFHTSIDQMGIPQNINAYSIQGCGVPTTRRLVEFGKKFGEDEWVLQIGDGDGTVPLLSAEYVSIPEDHKISIPKVEHAEMPSNDLVVPAILSILQNSPTTSEFSYPNECGVTGTLISVHSPVDLSATNSEGQFVGVLESGDTEYSIPGSKYEQLGENKFIFLPYYENEEPYEVRLEGTATGTFNARVTTIVNDIPEETQLFLDIPVNNRSIGSISLTGDANTPATIQYDLSGDGHTITLTPDATTTETDESDLTPPTTTIQVVGSQGTNGWHRSIVTTTLTGVDVGSGMLRTMYSLDSGVTWNTYIRPIVFTADGRYTIQYFSIDTLGNREEIKTISLSIDKTPPEARFSFNSQIQDVSVVGTDNMSTTTVSTTPNSYIVKDQAGNTLQLVFGEINRPILKRASLNRLVYNGRIVVPNTRLTSFVWLTNMRNEISSLQQALRYDLDEGLYALYTRLGGRTFIRERTNWNTFTDRYENGMKVFNFTTNNGVINYQ